MREWIPFIFKVLFAISCLIAIPFTGALSATGLVILATSIIEDA